MTSTKSEILAAGICGQIAYLEGVLKELESDPEQDKNVALKIREVETQLQKLRGRL